jgi:hypothetical protein
MLVVEEFAAAEANQRSAWPRAKGMDDERQRPMEESQPHLSRRSRCHGAAVGRGYAAATDAAAKPCHLNSKSSNTSA